MKFGARGMNFLCSSLSYLWLPKVWTCNILTDVKDFQTASERAIAILLSYM